MDKSKTKFELKRYSNRKIVFIKMYLPSRRSKPICLSFFCET